MPSPPEFSRRRLLTGTAAVTAGAVASGALLSACSDDADASDVASTAAAGASRVAFEGRHQAGITTPPQRHAIVASFDSTATDRVELVEMLRSATAEARALVAGEVADARSKLLPPVDNLIVGVEPPPDDLTITFAVGSSLFDDRYGLADRRPKQLVEMPAFANDDPEPSQSGGDLLIQVCSATPEGCNHALRRVMRVTRDSLTLRWMLPGFQEPNTLGPGRTSQRNLMGFKDGTANLDGSDDATMDDLVWVSASDGEPEWAVEGTYMVARRIRMRVEFWDRTALHTQEAIIGRFKDTGAPLDGVYETDVPAYADDVDGVRTPLTAHIRLANPRTPETEKHRILRRGFSFSQGFTPDGQLDQGLLFVCFQRSLADGFLAVQGRLDGEALEEYIKPVGGGFYFALPGVTTADGYLGEGLLS
jgi:deferrochelatase/peroxidase EfeB